MSPITSEKTLEEELVEAKIGYQESCDKLNFLRKELSVLETEYVERRLIVDRITEELRRFRLAYPKYCKSQI